MSASQKNPSASSSASSSSSSSPSSPPSGRARSSTRPSPARTAKQKKRDELKAQSSPTRLLSGAPPPERPFTPLIPVEKLNRPLDLTRFTPPPLRITNQNVAVESGFITPVIPIPVPPAAGPRYTRSPYDPPRPRSPGNKTPRSPSPPNLLTTLISHPSSPDQQETGEFDITNPSHITTRRLRSLQNPRLRPLWHSEGRATGNLWETLDPYPSPGHYRLLPPKAECKDTEPFITSFTSSSIKLPPEGGTNTLGWMKARINPTIAGVFASYEANDLQGGWVLKHQWAGCWISLDGKMGWYKVPMEDHLGPGATSSGKWPGVECLGSDGERDVVGRRIRFLGEYYETIRKRELKEKVELEKEEEAVLKEREERWGVSKLRRESRMEALRRRGVDYQELVQSCCEGAAEASGSGTVTLDPPRGAFSTNTGLATEYIDPMGFGLD
ncbi:hypothetical protein TWF481_008805 [Arthrobotrys musiformis]|uniref:Uncharacterized protein n=1 Tax=Arthrobotrys musiformis TaxID=47236 RepID=A0AAV9WA85_9PEZI